MVGRAGARTVSASNASAVEPRSLSPAYMSEIGKSLAIFAGAGMSATLEK